MYFNNTAIYTTNNVSLKLFTICLLVELSGSAFGKRPSMILSPNKVL